MSIQGPAVLKHFYGSESHFETQNLRYVCRKPAIQFPRSRFVSILRRSVIYVSGQKGFGVYRISMRG
jgi:hypothetical protein